MASGSNYQPPERFTFSKLEGWPSWITRFEWYRIVSSLDRKEEKRQVSSLIYSTGKEVEDNLKSFSLSDAKLKSCRTVRDKLESFSVEKRNIAFDRISFFQGRED